MSKNEISYKSKMPKIKNIFVYSYCCISKICAIIFFGLGAIVLAILVFPFIRLFTLHKKDFGIKQAFRNIHSKIIIANHPSLLDFVYIMSLVPNSTCIVRGGLTHTPLRGVIKQAYITNTTDFDDVLEECKKLTDKGCNVIIFPEGTRSPRIGRNNYKKGAARIALYCGCDVQPIFIGGSDKYGLGKHDPLWSYNHVENYLYDIKLLPVISIEQFKGLSEPIAAKHLTEEMEKVIRSAGDEYAKTYTGQTLNNY